ncbi:hypothetical protein NIES2101_09405 [Calothrix sp. HK-06]|nr:hypothetical protein NIES2101_09405 [Calothrix sp. HK-06]
MCRRKNELQMPITQKFFTQKNPLEDLVEPINQLVLSKERNAMLNQQLRDLVEQMKQLPPSSREWRKLLNQLLKILNTPGVLSSIETLMYRGVTVHSRRIQLICPEKWREEVYAEAKANAFVRIVEGINNYKPEKATFKTWVNQILGVEYLKAHNNIVRNKVQTMSLDAISHDSTALSEEDKLLREFIEQDTGELLRKPLSYINQETQVKGRILLKEVLLMLLDGYKQKDIRSELHIPPQSLSSFIKRNGEKAIDYLRKNGFDFEPNIEKKRKVDDTKNA